MYFQSVQSHLPPHPLFLQATSLLLFLLFLTSDQCKIPSTFALTLAIFVKLVVELVAF